MSDVLHGFSPCYRRHYLQQIISNHYGFDLKDHLQVIVIGIVLVTTAPVIIKLVTGREETS